MSTNLVIVAIPDENDRVWKIASEKVPHLTLLFLGDSEQVSNLDSIMQFVEHAADRSLRRFYLPVDRRGELGADNADVLFFKKGRYDFKAVRDFRSLLLQDSNIKTAYDATSQFETPENVGAPGQAWIPHLTLGYPTSPAKEIPDDQLSAIYDVQFNKIAVWAGDYEGPEFLLKDYWDEMDDFPMDAPVSVAMSELAHYGKKGMKWGVRNDPKSENKNAGWLDPEGKDLSTDVVKAVLWPLVPPLGLFSGPAQVRLVRGGARGAKAKAVDVQEKQFTKKAMSEKNFVEIHNRSTARFNRDIKKVNDKHPGDLTKDPKKQKAYDADVQKLMQDTYREAAKSIGNKADTMHLDVQFEKNGIDFKIVAKPGQVKPLPKQVKHAADDNTFTYAGKIKRDATGHILGLEFDDFKPQTMKHTTDLGAENVVTQTIGLGAKWLAHYGVKGMRWGQRRERGTPGFFETKSVIAEAKTREKRTPIAPRAIDTIGSSERKQTKIKTKGGEDHPATEDALRVAASTQKLKKSGVHALSNQELQEVAQRLNLETQVSVLVGKRVKKGPGAKFVEEQLKKAQQDPIRTFKEGTKAAKTGATAYKVGRTVLKTRKLAGVP